MVCSRGLSQLFFIVAANQIQTTSYSPHEKASAEAEAFLNPLERSYLAASALPASEAAYLRRKRSTRPAVSTSFCLPVKNGWQAEHISTWMSPLWVERVTKFEPQAHITLISL